MDGVVRSSRCSRSMQRGYGALGMIISPLLSILMGLIVLIFKLMRERERVPLSRAVGGAA